MSAKPEQQPWTTFRPKAAVSVSAMAKVVSLSRSQFHAYIERGVFPYPMYAVRTKRPFYTYQMQQEIVQVRATGVGANGEFVLFYEKRGSGTGPRSKHSTAAPATGGRYGELLEELRGLGLKKVTAGDVERAVAIIFPGGTSGREAASEVLPAVFRHLKREGVE